MKLRSEEIKRKVLHIFSGLLIPAAIFYSSLYLSICLPSHWSFPRYEWIILLLGVIAIVQLLIDIIRIKVPAMQTVFYKYFGAFLRSEEKAELTGSTYIFIASFLCAVCFPADIAAIVICLFILGDGVAALVGQSIGRIKIGKKSLEGSLSCFALCLILIYGLFPFTPHLLDKWGGSLSILSAIIISALITIFELFPIKIKSFVINDNLIVPLIAGFAMVLLRRGGI